MSYNKNNDICHVKSYQIYINCIKNLDLVYLLDVAGCDLQVRQRTKCFELRLSLSNPFAMAPASSTLLSRLYTCNFRRKTTFSDTKRFPWIYLFNFNSMSVHLIPWGLQKQRSTSYDNFDRPLWFWHALN